MKIMLVSSNEKCNISAFNSLSVFLIQETSFARGGKTVTREVSTTRVKSRAKDATAHVVKITRTPSETSGKVGQRIPSDSGRHTLPVVNGSNDLSPSPWHVTSLTADGKPAVTERKIMLTTEL